MTSAKIKKRFKAHSYFCNGALECSYKLFDLSDSFGRGDKDRELRNQIHQLTWDLGRKLREFYGPKIGEAVMREIS